MKRSRARSQRGRPRKRRAAPVKRKVVKRRRVQSKGDGVFRMGAYGAAALAAYTGRSRTRTAPSRTRTVRDGGTYQQWESYRFKRRYGRLTQRKINKLTLRDPLNLSWRRLANLDAGTGALYFSNYYTAGSAAGVPMYIVELDSCVNNINGTITAFSPVYVPVRTESPGYQWLTQNGQDPTGLDAGAWQVERAGGTSTITTNYPHENSILRWVDIRMDLFGMKQHPTKFFVELVQLDPLVQPASGTNTDVNHVRFWDTQLRSCIFNPNFTTTGYGANRMKRIMDRRVVEIQPTSTSESDADPHIKTLKLFYSMNRLCRYNWRDYGTSVENPTDLQFNTGVYSSAIGDNTNQTHPRARIYLLIRAVKFYRNQTFGVQSNVDTPSMNIQIRTQHVKAT